MKKKLEEMTFREFLEEAERAGRGDVMDNVKSELFDILHEDGFTDEQVYELKMDRIWDVLIKILGDEFEKFFSLFS